MTLTHQHAPSVSWTEPEGLAPRGTLIIVPGRGEQPEVYERFGRRISADAYRVQVVSDPTEDAALADAQIESALGGPLPVVLVGSDTGALYAAGLVASGRLAKVDALILAGLPVTAEAAVVADGEEDEQADSWRAELDARTTCPTHRGRLAGGIVRPGALYEPIPDGWADLADFTKITQPILGVHGADDPVSPLPTVRARYTAAPHAEFVSVTGTTHDALNNATHRTVAASIVLFLERLRNGADLAPIIVREEF